MSPVRPTPENPVLDVTERRRKEARFLHKVGYRPKVIMVVLREVDLDNLWGVRTVIVKPQCFARGECFSKLGGRRGVSDLRRQIRWAIKFFVKLKRICQSRAHVAKGVWRSHGAKSSLKDGGKNSHWEVKPLLEG